MAGQPRKPAGTPYRSGDGAILLINLDEYERLFDFTEDVERIAHLALYRHRQNPALWFLLSGPCPFENEAFWLDRAKQDLPKGQFLSEHEAVDWIIEYKGITKVPGDLDLASRLCTPKSFGDDAADTKEKVIQVLPNSPDVRDLCRLLEKARDKIASGDITEIGVARKFTKETAGNDRKAKSLLRQARRFPHLWKR